LKLYSYSDNVGGHGRDDGDADSKTLCELENASLGPGLGVKSENGGSLESVREWYFPCGQRVGKYGLRAIVYRHHKAMFHPH